MPDDELKYHKRLYVLKQGITATSLDRWSVMLRNTSMVGRLKDSSHELVYSDDFVKFLLSRKGITGPSNLPDPQDIAKLYAAVRAKESIQTIASLRGVSPLVIEMQLKEIGAVQ